MLGFELLGRNVAKLHFKTERVAEIALRGSWFWAILGGFPATWGIFSRPGDSKLTCDGLGFQWNGQRKNIWTLGFKLLGRNVAQLHFKTERVAESAISASWFWPTLGGFPATWGIFFSPGDFKLTRDGISFLWNGQRKNKLTPGFELLGQNIDPLHFKTERVAKSSLRACWFRPTFGGFPATWRIVISPRDSKLTRDGLGFQLNGQRKNNWTLGFKLLA